MNEYECLMLRQVQRTFVQRLADALGYPTAWTDRPGGGEGAMVRHSFSCTHSVCLELDFHYGSYKIHIEDKDISPHFLGIVKSGILTDLCGEEANHIAKRFRSVIDKPWENVLTELKHWECMYVLNRLEESGDQFKNLLTAMMSEAYDRETFAKFVLLLKNAILDRGEKNGFPRKEMREYFDRIGKTLLAAGELIK